MAANKTKIYNRLSAVTGICLQEMLLATKESVTYLSHPEFQANTTPPFMKPLATALAGRKIALEFQNQ